MICALPKCRCRFISKREFFHFEKDQNMTFSLDFLFHYAEKKIDFSCSQHDCWRSRAGRKWTINCRSEKKTNYKHQFVTIWSSIEFPIYLDLAKREITPIWTRLSHMFAANVLFFPDLINFRSFVVGLLLLLSLLLSMRSEKIKTFGIPYWFQFRSIGAQFWLALSYACAYIPFSIYGLIGSTVIFNNMILMSEATAKLLLPLLLLLLWLFLWPLFYK